MNTTAESITRSIATLTRNAERQAKRARREGDRTNLARSLQEISTLDRLQAGFSDSKGTEK